MPWVRFTEDFMWSPTRRFTIAYKAGMHVLVTTPCAEEAKAKGKAVSAKSRRALEAENAESR